MASQEVLLLCLVLPWSHCMTQEPLTGPALGLKKEAEIERKMEKLRDNWLLRWLASENAPQVNLTRKQQRWWDLLEYREKPNKPEDSSTPCPCDEPKETPEVQHVQHSHNHGRRRKRAACDPIPGPRVTRLEWRRMNTEMRNEFRDAMNRVATFAPDPSQPDVTAHHIFVSWHNGANAPGAHGGAAFLPWHREFLWRFENALRQQGYSYGLPYWDAALDAMLPDQSMSALFTPEHMGVSRGEVTTWGGETTQVKASNNCMRGGRSAIIRNAPTGSRNAFFTRNKINSVLALNCYKDLTFGVNRLFEGFHNGGHSWFGSSSHMRSVRCSPTDPMFWMHHGFVDLLWEAHREIQDPRDREIDYPQTDIGARPEAMAWNSVMRPFSGRMGFGHSGDRLLNIHGLSNHYTSYYYKYENRPSSIQCETDDDCNGDGPGLLWCDTVAKLCYAKIQDGGACDSASPNNQCWCSNTNNPSLPVCTNLTCQCQPLTTPSTIKTTTEAIATVTTTKTTETSTITTTQDIGTLTTKETTASASTTTKTPTMITTETPTTVTTKTTTTTTTPTTATTKTPTTATTKTPTTTTTKTPTTATTKTPTTATTKTPTASATTKTPTTATTKTPTESATTNIPTTATTKTPTASAKTKTPTASATTKTPPTTTTKRPTASATTKMPTTATTETPTASATTKMPTTATPKTPTVSATTKTPMTATTKIPTASTATTTPTAATIKTPRVSTTAKAPTTAKTSNTSASERASNNTTATTKIPTMPAAATINKSTATTKTAATAKSTETV